MSGSTTVAVGTALRTIKILHTIIRSVFVVVIGAIWMFTAPGNFAGAACAIAIVLVDVALPGLHHGQCPPGRVAGRYTGNRRADFDTHLPVWLAARTKVIFGPLFGAAIIFTVFRPATVP